MWLTSFYHIATRMHSSIIEYTTAVAAAALDIHFIASQAAPAIAAAATVRIYLS